MNLIERPFTPHEYEALRHAAIQQAQVLRREAFDAAWRSAAATLVWLLGRVGTALPPPRAPERTG